MGGYNLRATLIDALDEHHPPIGLFGQLSGDDFIDTQGTRYLRKTRIIGLTLQTECLPLRFKIEHLSNLIHADS